METRMPHLFAVTEIRGGPWDRSQPLDGQAGWREHAQFMDRLVEEGFVALGGPLEGEREVLLIVRAEDEAEVLNRLGPDPWIRSGHLRLGSVLRWTLRLGSLA